MGALSASIVGVSAEKLAFVDLIEREFVAAGYSLSVAAAAVVNAYAESGLNPLAIGDNGRSVGLFQLNIRGAGAGMTVGDDGALPQAAARQDATTNVRTLIARERSALGKVAAGAAAGEGIPRLAALFSTYVERPANKPLSESYRSALALRLFPLGVRAEVAAPDRSTPEATKRSTNTVFLWGLAGLATIGLLSAVLRARNLAERASRSGV